MSKENKYRRLAAVMFTDIVGYTALMHADEKKAAGKRQKHREVFEKSHGIYHGEILQYFGDGTLSVFQSGVEAVECAIEIQKELNQKNGIPLRIGLHIGDIVFDGTDIYGDGVNLASRIESMGVAGGVLLSGKLNDELRNQAHISTQSLGYFSLKNISQPVEVFSVTNKAVNVPERSELKGKQEAAKRTIAVLPFVNRSTNEDAEYLSDGMTEEIINALSKINNLKVTSRTSSFFFKNKNIPLPEIGRELNVSNILEGSVRLAGNKIRISATLVDVVEDVQFWSKTFDRSFDDIFSVQDEISLLIADKLREHIGHFEIAEKLVEPPDVSVENYKRYLKARFHILKMSHSEIEKGMTILKEIIAEQPSFPLAHIGVHLGYTLLGALGMVPALEAFSEARPYLEKAIELNEDLPEVQLNLSYDSFLQKWDLDSTYKHLNKSFEIRPTVEYYQSMASTLVADAKYEAGHNYIDTAIQIDPFSSINFHLKGYLFYCQEKYAEAIKCYKKSIELDPHAQVSPRELGQALILQGKAREALSFFSDLPDGLIKEAGLTIAHAALGNLRKSEEGMEKLEAALETSQMERAINMLVNCHTLLGNHEKALDYFEKGVDLKLPLMIYMPVEPILKPLSDNPRFKEISQKIFGKRTNPELPKRKYKKSLLGKNEIEKYKAQLEQLMLDEQPYLNPDLTLRNLADMLNLPPNYLSQLLNEGFDKNFSEFVNSYRLEVFKSKISEPSSQNLTILGLAFESGFNSKTVFNTFFKKAMGKTPAAYRKEVLDK